MPPLPSSADKGTVNVDGTFITLNIIGWVLALFAHNEGKRTHAHHLNRKAPL